MFGGIVTGIVFLIRAQSKELAAKATAGINQLHAFLNTGPIPVSDQQIAAARDNVQKIFSSSGFGAEAPTGARTIGEILAGIGLMAVTFVLPPARR